MKLKFDKKKVIWVFVIVAAALAVHQISGMFGQ